MKVIKILVALMTLCIITQAEEITLPLERAALITPSVEQGNLLNNRIAVYFPIPENVLNSMIIYAELIFPISVADNLIEGDTYLEISTKPIMVEWDLEDSDFIESTDSNAYYSITLDLAEPDTVHIDINGILLKMAYEEYANHGIMLIPFKFDQPDFDIPETVAQALLNHGKVKLIFE